MKVEICRPDGTPYITMSDDRLMVSMQIHDYDFLGEAVKFNFDRRTIPALIEGLQRLQKDTE
jgi:hypothetical protein